MDSQEQITVQQALQAHHQHEQSLAAQQQQQQQQQHQESLQQQQHQQHQHDQHQHELQHQHEQHPQELHQHELHQPEPYQHDQQQVQQTQQLPVAQQAPQQHPSPLSQTQQHDPSQIQVGGPQPPAPQAPTSTIDSLTCQWTGCGERCQSPEALYDHVCERHVGRKSTNNLNLTCQWGACRTTTVKRDHITSHIRVHVPLKPHKCDFCGKAFKRPQDLKKHVKTHADDSVLMRSPDPNMQNRGAGVNTPYQQNGKPGAGYYGPGQDMSQPHPYPAAHTAHMASNQFNYQAPQQYSAYGQVSYPAPTANSLQDMQSMDTRKRAIEALNDFLGDIKRRAIDPAAYYDVGQRLQSQNLPLPISSGFGYSTGNNYNTTNSYNNNNANGIMDSFGGAGGIMNGAGGAMTQGPLSQSYSLPLPNARTKNDLQDIDRFLEQLQATVYENSGTAAAAGVQQPGVHTQYPGFNNHYRTSDSPPNMQYGGQSASAAAVNIAPNLSSMASSASALETPALTPASVTSYASSSHSPMSTHSRSSMSSVNGSNMYPSLPSVTAVSDMGAGYPATSSAPSSALAFDDGFNTARRFSGSRLQREAPAKTEHDDAMDMDEGAKTPRNAKEADEQRPGSSSLDPALRGGNTPTQSAIQSPNTNSSNSDGDKGQENWVENIRVIESLRQWIRERIDRQEFDNDEHEEQAHEGAQPEHIQHEHIQHIEHIDHSKELPTDMQHDHEPTQEGEIAYPVLKSEVA